MCQQQFQAEVMDELKQKEMIEVCVYCGNEKVNNWMSCCGEVHFEIREVDDNE